MLGMGNSISTEFFQDEITKNFLQDYAAEHFEIASYKGLIETARQIGEHQCIPILEGILREEEVMARWIEEHMPLAIRIGLEKTTQSGGRRRSSNRSFYGKLQNNQALSTIVIGGAIGAAALYFMRQNQNQHTRRVEKIKTVPHQETEGIAGRHNSIGRGDVDNVNLEIPTTDNRVRAAGGNS
jgi:hypothetical protein